MLFIATNQSYAYGPSVEPVYVSIQKDSIMEGHLYDAKVTETDTQQEAVKKINAWICKNMTYDLTHAHVDLGTAIHDQRGVCLQYAQIMYEMCNCAGIETKVQYGQINGILHAWVKSYINGMELHTDPTWNQSAGCNKWVLVTKTKMKQDHDFYSGGLGG